MNIWKKLFGGRKTPSPSTLTQAAPAATAAPPAPDGLKLPPEFDGKMSYRQMFQTLPPERLRTMCRALPVEQLDLYRPGRPPFAREMGRAITQVFAVSIYMATKEVPTEFGDIVLPRLVRKISEYDGSDLHLELCDLVRDFAIELVSGGRYREAARVMRVLKRSLFWNAWPQGDICLFASLNNIALDTKLPSDFEAAFEAAKRVPASQMQQIDPAIKNLKQKMEELTDSAAKGQEGSTSAHEAAQLAHQVCDLPEEATRGQASAGSLYWQCPRCLAVMQKGLARIFHSAVRGWGQNPLQMPDVQEVLRWR
jgi:hypothetical protein